MQNNATIDLYFEIRAQAIELKEKPLEQSRKALRNQIISNGFILTKEGQKIEISTSVGRLGGVQAWLVCPTCTKSFRKLYLKESELGCRNCRKVGYRSRALSKLARKGISRAIHFLNKAESIRKNAQRLGSVKQARISKYIQITENIIHNYQVRLNA